MSSSPNTLHVQGLTVRRYDTVILDDVEWTVKAGEQWVILGANGSGKTSLLNTLSGILPATDGAIQVFGETFGMTDWSKLREVIGIVNHTLSGWINEDETTLETVIGGIYNQINYWGEITREDYDRAIEILERYELDYAAERIWQQLSQGERQRTLICRALLANFKLLILDEPCAGLDPVARGKFLRFIEGLTQQDDAPALILVTHHVEEITPGFTHVLLLKEGQVFKAGPKEEVMNSKCLSEAFQSDLKLHLDGSSYRLELTP